MNEQSDLSAQSEICSDLPYTGVGKSRFAVVSLGNTEFILV